MAKYIFVTGGVVSGLGKGITAASLGRLLKSRGLKVAAQKLDPYINVDPGTMSPYQHGEVYVTEGKVADQASGGCDDDVCSKLQGAFLLFVAYAVVASVDAYAGDSFEVV